MVKKVSGLSMPVKTSVGGGAKTDKGDRQTFKILKAALTEGDDLNPFQDLGILSNIIYDLNNPATQAEAKLEVERILKKFRGKIELSPTDPIRIVPGKSPEEFGIAFKYVDLNTNKTEEFEEFFSRAGGTSV